MPKKEIGVKNIKRKETVKAFTSRMKGMINSHNVVEHYLRSRRKKEGTIVPKHTNVIKGKGG
mgnify:FL=1|tara:strand:+ start:9945 stop:10130 length:186 start_codon:yes stop_codon:yes gene_type:complete